MDLRDIYHLLRAATTREEGQTMAEYGVVLTLITLAIVGALSLLALGISGKLGFVTNTLGSALPTS
jgi:Flp pilus assembly pilin Flp